MLTRLFRHSPPTAGFPDVPDFPERADLPHLSEQEAEAALALLRLLVAQDRASNLKDVNFFQDARHVPFLPWLVNHGDAYGRHLSV
jgi:hypothetical protein